MFANRPKPKPEAGGDDGRNQAGLDNKQFYLNALVVMKEQLDATIDACTTDDDIEMVDELKRFRELIKFEQQETAPMQSVSNVCVFFVKRPHVICN